MRICGVSKCFWPQSASLPVQKSLAGIISWGELQLVRTLRQEDPQLATVSQTFILVMDSVGLWGKRRRRRTMRQKIYETNSVLLPCFVTSTGSPLLSCPWESKVKVGNPIHGSLSHRHHPKPSCYPFEITKASQNSPNYLRVLLCLPVDQPTACQLENPVYLLARPENHSGPLSLPEPFLHLQVGSLVFLDFGSGSVEWEDWIVDWILYIRFLILWMIEGFLDCVSWWRI